MTTVPKTQPAQITREDGAAAASRAPRSMRWANIATAALLFVVLPLATEHAMPKLLQPADYLNVDIGVALAVGALSLNLLLGYTGQISLGHSGLLAVGGFASGIAASQWDAPMVFAIPFGVIVAAAVALIVGLPALRLRGLYLAIVTVVFGLVMQYSVLPSTVFSGGSAGVAFTRRTWGSSDFTDNAVYLVVCLLLLLAVWVLDGNVVRTRIGRAFRTIRENEAVAQSFGIDVTRYKLLAFVVSGAIAGLAGAMWGYAITHVNSESPFNFSQSLQLVIIVIVGGLGRPLAVVIAALFFWVLPSFISGAHAYAYVIGAFLLMATVAAHPQGIADLLHPQRRPKLDEASDEDEPMPPLPQLPMPARLTYNTATDAPMLEVSDVVVRFGGLYAVDHASLVVPTGKIIGLIGPNGAGKSTLFNAVSGLVRLESGEIRYRGQPLQQLGSDRRARLGIARSFQQVGLAKDLTMRENFLLAQHQLARYGDGTALLMLPKAQRVERELAARADQAIEALGFGDLAQLPVRNLSGGQQRIVEIACLLVTAPDLVLLDEPSAGMAPGAAENLAARMRDLRDSLGRTVLLIEHNVPLVLDTCDYVYVLDAGRIIASGEPREIAANQAVIDAYFGSAVPA